jgi:hypothetical protein
VRQIFAVIDEVERRVRSMQKNLPKEFHRIFLTDIACGRRLVVLSFSGSSDFFVVVALAQGVWYNVNMNRTVTRIGKISDKRNDEYVPGSISSRIALVWPLTEEVTSLSNKYNAERRLQRDVAIVNRREC